MSYFGWIPILTPKLLFLEAIKDLETYCLTNTDDECILPPKINLSSSSKLTKKQEIGYCGFFTEELKQQIKNHLQVAENEKLYLYLRDFDDIDIHSLTKVAFTVDRTTSKIRKIGIFSHTTFKIIAIAEILAIEDTGLINYKLKGKYNPLSVKKIFGEIRDIYHEHIYVPHGDFALMPVETNDRNEAI